MDTHDGSVSWTDGIAQSSSGGAVMGGCGAVVQQEAPPLAPASTHRDEARAETVADVDDDAPFEREFARLLHREKRRSERSKSPLSLVVYHAGDVKERSALATDEFLERLRDTTRETDILRRICHDTIAVLCPYTDAQGAEAFIRKMASCASGLPFASSRGTYPDPRFDALADQVRRLAKPKAFAPLVLTDDEGCAYSLKRPLDIFGALVAIFLFAPLMLIVVAIIKLTSRGPVIFRQTRLGHGGVPFTFFKFRSMATDVDDRIHREFVASLIHAGATDAASEAEGAFRYKLKSDPRVTQVGAFIRKTSIDELPQFFNVLRGDMSIVGPRPPIPYEIDHYQSWHLRRILTAKPGITGLWQVEGRSRVSFDEMVRMDLRYTQACSLVTDLKIMLKTVGVVLRGTGAA